MKGNKFMENKIGYEQVKYFCLVRKMGTLKGESFTGAVNMGYQETVRYSSMLVLNSFYIPK